MPGKMCLLRNGEYQSRFELVLRCGNLVFVLVALYSVLSSTEFLVARCLSVAAEEMSNFVGVLSLPVLF